ncbi:nuclear receptor-binding protein-like [Dendronephthya gigantea]|uniref:nuclear receptor-binding protein-like n=1 Tax=Dendronephthya gigantea TaxID=151771 RepID=UPI00106CF904|nr:nuclear receptor-binding protein-like [Dendronephthya gigantea]XP_028411961.1 nuclear receptor-binding protein-like [Dendronephthya gigantea]
MASVQSATEITKPGAISTDSGEESDDAYDDVIEVSPCGRWEKRRIEVTQRDVPGIDKAFLAMDTEEGVEVVWNEVQFSQRKSYKAQEATIKTIFQNLTKLKHPNIVKFHRFWNDMQGDKARLVFISEYMTAGSLKKFLKKTRANNKTISPKVVRKWCRQILSALSYLHACNPPIVHGNLSCDTIFIQHNGLIKIGSVAPDTIRDHVKTYHEERRNMHYLAPEYGLPGTSRQYHTAVDVFAFGICTLEMAALELQDKESHIGSEAVKKAIDGLTDDDFKDFIGKCLIEDPVLRPSVMKLMFHKWLFEVPSLKLLSAYAVVDTGVTLPESKEVKDRERILVDIPALGGNLVRREKDLPSLEREKYLEEVQDGLYPLTIMERRQSHANIQRPLTPEEGETEENSSPPPDDVETRLVLNMNCKTKVSEHPGKRMLILHLQMDDQMNRLLTCDLESEDKAGELAEDLVKHGFINPADKERISTLIQTNLKREVAVA